MRNVAEWLELDHVFGHALHVPIVELVLSVDDGEHTLVEYDEEGVHDFGESDAAAVVVPLELVEEVGEDGRVLQVDDAICSFEHLVELAFRAHHHRTKEI